MVAQKLSAAADPRARLLRKRKWALRLGLFFGFASVFWVLVTGLLATWNTPVWALLITGLIGAGAAFPAALSLMRYRWLRPGRCHRSAPHRRLPPLGSAARQPMSALGASERGLVSLIGVMERGKCCPPTRSANCRSRLTSRRPRWRPPPPRWCRWSGRSAAPQSRAHLAPTINAFTAQLGAGVRQYNEMVTAAAQLVSAANGRGELTDFAAALSRRTRTATDRLSAGHRLSTSWANCGGA